VFVLGIKLYRDIHCPFFELKLGNKCGTAFKKHSHEWFSLGIVRNGETSFWYDGRTSELHEGNVVFMPPGFMHSCNPVDVDRWRFIMLFVDPGWFSLPLDVDGTVMNGIVLNRASGCDIASTLVGILKPLTDKAGPLEKEEMITAAVRYVIESSGMSLSAEGTVPGRRLETIREYIFSHFREGVTPCRSRKYLRIGQVRYNPRFQRNLPYFSSCVSNHSANKLFQEGTQTGTASAGCSLRCRFLRSEPFHPGLQELCRPNP
jgi:hypothetical protein